MLAQDGCPMVECPELSYYGGTVTNTNEYTVKLYFNILRNDDGSNEAGSDVIEFEDLKYTKTQLDAAFNPHGIYFEYVCEAKYINNSYFNRLALMSIQYDLGEIIPIILKTPICEWRNSGLLHFDGIDVFITQSDSGAKGIAEAIPGRIAIIKSEAIATSNSNTKTTIVHEIGHLLGLFHTSHGSTTNPGNYPSGRCINYLDTICPSADCSSECWDANGRSLKESFYDCILGKKIKDGHACAEHAGNGAIAGDYIVDTPPTHVDYEKNYATGHARCTPHIGILSLGGKDILDGAGNMYNPDYTNFMAQFTAQCPRTQFTSGQGNVMKNFIGSHPDLNGILSSKGPLACDCDYKNIIYYRYEKKWSDIVAAHNLSTTTLQDYKIMIEGDLIIDQNYTFEGVDFNITEGHGIAITNNANVTITESTNNKSNLFPCSGRWEGIHVDPGTTLNINDGTTIGSVKNGIVAAAGSTLHIDDLIIDDIEYDGIKVKGNLTASTFNNIVINNAQRVGLFITNSPNQVYKIENSEIYSDIWGIYVTGSSATIENNTIEADFGLNFTNSTGSIAIGNTIKSDGKGIYALKCAALRIEDNTISSIVPYGVQGEYGIYMVNVQEANINNNTIQVARYGIWTYATHKVQITDNIIAALVGYNHSGAISMNRPLACEIKDNYISGVNTPFSVEVVDGATNTIGNNEITNLLPYVLGNYNNSGVIRLLGTVDATVEENIIHANAYDGIVIQNSTSNLIDCNEIYDAETGLNILFNSDGQGILTNEFYDDYYDLIIRSEIGIQPYHGNEFHDEGRARAYNLSPVQISNSQFYVNSNVNPLHMPGDPIPGNGQWFDNSTNVVTYETCGGIPGPGWVPFDGDTSVLCNYYSRLKGDKTQDYNSFFVQMYHLLAMDSTLNQYNLPECIVNDSLFWAVCGLEARLATEMKLEGIIRIDENNTSLVNQVNNLLLDQGDYIDGNMSFSNYSNEVIATTALVDQERVQDSIDYASTLNQANAGICLDSVSNYWKEMLGIEFSFLLNDTLYFRDSIKLGAMASVCSDYYGDPIHLSRSFLTLLDDVYYDNNDGCRIDNRIRSNPLSDTEEKVLSMNVFPNPILHETKINFSDKVTGSYYLLDLNGKVIKEGTIENNRDFTLDCSHFSTGTYILNVVTSTSQLSEKLVIIHE